MVKNKSKQRGFTQVAAAALLAAFAALLVMTGCSSDIEPVEHIDSVTQRLTCGLGGVLCPADTVCGSWSCGRTGLCEVTQKSADGALCGTRIQPGACIQGLCCPSCGVLTKTGPACAKGDGTGPNQCGAPGTICANCATNACQVPVCDPNKLVCANTAIPDGDGCSIGTGACLGGTCCRGCMDANHACQQTNTTTACGLSSATAGLVKCEDCSDTNSCTADACVSGACMAPYIGDGQSCSDQNACNGDEICGNGQCKAGSAPNCDDQNPCTVDSCDAVKGCVNTPVEAGTSCDSDGDACNGVNTCVGSVCTPGTAVDCDDNNICTDDSCTKATGKCVNAPNTLACSDNNLCTVTDKCANGKCVGTGAPNCDDHQDCTSDSCDPALGCQNKAVANDTVCDDGNACSTGDKCTNGKCLSTGGKSCDDSNPCTKNQCDPAVSVCTFPAETNGTPCVSDKCHQNSTCEGGACAQGVAINCDDSNPCTADSCDPTTGCKHVNADGLDCSDNDACTHNDKCQTGKCVGVTVVCMPLDECHVAGTCNLKGTCDDPRADDGIACKNKLGSGTCQTGICQIVEAAGGAGGAGGEPGAGGEGGTVAQGGEPPILANGGVGNELTGGGEPTTPSAGKSGKGGSSNVEGGAADVPEHVFVRDPGGCSCSVPSERRSSDWLWLGALAVAAGAARRRRGKNRMLA